MSEAALEEVSVLSSIYYGEGEFRVLQHNPANTTSLTEDGLVVQINCCSGEDCRQNVSVMFHLHPSYPSSPPDISVSSTGFSRTQCHAVRQKLLDRAAVLPPEPMLHQLVEDFQQHCVELTKDLGESKERMKESERVEEWTEVLLLDHIRSRNRYIGLLEHWSQQLQLAGRLLLGQNILVILQGERRNIKEFRHRLKTVKVDVDASGKKCKERMMKVLVEVPSSSTFRNSLQGFVVNSYQSLSELTAVFQELNMTQVYQQVLPSLNG